MVGRQLWWGRFLKHDILLHLYEQYSGLRDWSPKLEGETVAGKDMGNGVVVTGFGFAGVG